MQLVKAFCHVLRLIYYLPIWSVVVAHILCYAVDTYYAFIRSNLVRSAFLSLEIGQRKMVLPLT